MLNRLDFSILAMLVQIFRLLARKNQPECANMQSKEERVRMGVRGEKEVLKRYWPIPIDIFEIDKRAEKSRAFASIKSPTENSVF